MIPLTFIICRKLKNTKKRWHTINKIYHFSSLFSSGHLLLFYKFCVLFVFLSLNTANIICRSRGPNFLKVSLIQFYQLVFLRNPFETVSINNKSVSFRLYIKAHQNRTLCVASKEIDFSRIYI